MRQVLKPVELDTTVIDDALARGRHALADAGTFESAELIRNERDIVDVHDRAERPRTEIVRNAPTEHS